MEKKEIIRLLEQHTGVKAKYKGVPSFAFEMVIGGDTYMINKDGIITNATGNEIYFERPLQSIAERDPEEMYDKSSKEQLGIEVAVPMEEHTGITLKIWSI